MYASKFPEVDDLVMVNVRQIAEMGAYVQLLEYDNIEGMILLSELSRRRIRSIQKLIRVGKNEVVVVLRVDKEKGKRTPTRQISHLRQRVGSPRGTDKDTLSQSRIAPQRNFRQLLLRPEKKKSLNDSC